MEVRTFLGTGRVIGSWSPPFVSGKRPPFFNLYRGEERRCGGEDPFHELSPLIRKRKVPFFLLLEPGKNLFLCYK